MAVKALDLLEHTIALQGRLDDAVVCDPNDFP